MKKIFFAFLVFGVSLFTVFAQSDEDFFNDFDDDALFNDSFSDDDLFGDDSLFGGDDDLFFDDGIDEVETVTAKSDLSKGVLFENGSIKIGGLFTTSLGTSTVLFADNDDDFGDNFKNTTLTPTLDAFLSVDARPSQDLRLYTKFGFAYPFKSNAQTILGFDEIPIASYKIPLPTTATTSVSDYLKLKELFTDFSIADRAFFRFGIHTVTWGAGYFFSPVSDMINTSSINPEDVTAQVDGSLNLRTQITFPDSQNCLWLYLIPSTDFKNEYTVDSYAKDTALAGKADIVLGGWELGVGGFYKYQSAPKAMLTATGSLKKMSIFGEFVYQYGSTSEWQNNTDWDDKTSIIQATAGFSYYWKDPLITLAAQYYYDGNEKDMMHQYLTYGHNIAALANFGRIFGTTDITATIFGMVNFGKDEIPELYKSVLDNYGIASYLNAATFSAMLNYSPISALTIGCGPYITFSEWDEAPVVSLKLNFTLGGGKF